MIALTPKKTLEWQVLLKKSLAVAGIEPGTSQSRIDSANLLIITAAPKFNYLSWMRFSNFFHLMDVESF